MGISRDSLHKRRKTGAKKSIYRKKRKDTMGRPVTQTKIGSKRVRVIRVRGGNEKRRALRLDAGNFSWASEGLTRKARILDVVYNSTNNELVRTKTIVKNCIVQIDATPFKTWYEGHYKLSLSKKKKAAVEAAAAAGVSPVTTTESVVVESGDGTGAVAVRAAPAVLVGLPPVANLEELVRTDGKPVAKETIEKYNLRRKTAKIDPLVEEQFAYGKLYACISSRPGQVGRADGYILEGKELEFYKKKIRAKKSK